jgi:hypothetical protein
MLRMLKELRGLKLAASDGEIGKVREVYFDDTHWTVRYLVVDTGSWLMGREVLIPPHVLGEVDEHTGAMKVHLSKDQVRHSPPVESDKPVSRRYEEIYHEHYGWAPYWIVPGPMSGIWAMPSPATLAPELTASLQEESAQSAPHGDPHLRSSADLTGYGAQAQDGPIGEVADLVLDDQAWMIRYLVLDTGGWPGKDVLIVPEWIEAIRVDQGEIYIHLPVEKIRLAPPFDPTVPLSRGYEELLLSYYQKQGYWEAAAHDPAPASQAEHAQ